MEMEEIWLYALVGLVLGLLCGLLFALAWMSRRQAAERKVRERESETREQEYRQQIENSRREQQERLQTIQSAQDRAIRQFEMERDRLIQEKDKREDEFRKVLAQKELLGREQERLQAEQRLLSQRMVEKQREFEETQDRLRRDFELLANRIFDEKNARFQEQSRKEIGEVINPLRERIVEFQQNIQQVQREQSEQSGQLKQQIKQLTDLNQDMLQDARNLTNALKGDSKTQGNWGEFILESVLEKSGLEKGREYVVQASGANDEGRILRPDVVLNLPGNKHLILDSKVSLTAYEAFCSSTDSDEQERFAKAHKESVVQHVKQLSEKDYTSLYGTKTVDFVLLFVPVEPAFTLALRYHDALYMEAFARNVVLVTPSTLLATLRTIKHIWTQENQSRNVRLIAADAGKLHDKFVSLLEDLRQLGGLLEKSQSAYHNTVKKISEGHGNLIRRVHHLRELGAKTSKEIPEDLRELAMPADHEESETALSYGEDSTGGYNPNE